VEVAKYQHQQWEEKVREGKPSDIGLEIQKVFSKKE